MTGTFAIGVEFDILSKSTNGIVGKYITYFDKDYYKWEDFLILD